MKTAIARLRQLLLFVGAVMLFIVLLLTRCSAQEVMHARTTSINNSFSGYEGALSELFNMKEAHKFCYLATPAFEGEYCLSYDCETQSLVLQKAVNNVWYAQHWYSHPNNDTLPKAKVYVTKFKMPVSSTLADSLQALFAAIVFSSSPNEYIAGSDCTVHDFILPSITSKSASVDCPDGNSSAAVKIMNTLCDAVMLNKIDQAEGQLEEIISLTNKFRKYIVNPEKAKDYYEYCD